MARAMEQHLAEEAALEAGPPPIWEPMTQRRVLRLSIPIIGENLLQTAVGAVDTLLVSQLGSDAIAGVGIGVEVVFFIVAILSAVSIGATVLVAQAVGANDQRRANDLTRQAISWGLLFAIPLSIGGFYLAGPIVRAFGPEPIVAHDGTRYMEVIAANSVWLMLSFMLGAVLRGTGDGRTPLKAAVLANIVNVVAAYGLIFGHFGLPELGVAGSAWGASLGRAIASMFMLWVLWRGNASVWIRSKSGWRPHREIGRDLFRLGIPAAVEQILIEAGFTFIVAITASLGTKSLAAQQIAFTAMSLGFLPGIGFQITATALVGQSVGARRFGDAVKAAHIARRWAVVWTSCGMVFYLIFAKQLLGLFTSDPEVIRLGTNALRAIGVTLPLWGLWMTGAGALRGSGDTRSPMIRGVTVVWLSVVLAWVGVHFFHQSITWVWATFIITGPITAIGNWRGFARRAKDLIQEHGPEPQTASV